ncbi:hypothetical protein RISK_004844 [Rhodopirellula islandica]|uniref:Uncharacterized protein n=1 Tax=Rhodopirellula islandica TaxID=595434 RepID=A0A0J1B967_RHOIS|nr:hypothetical protein RISK_004844 [Rhodopirellula islandica]
MGGQNQERFGVIPQKNISDRGNRNEKMRHVPTPAAMQFPPNG